MQTSTIQNVTKCNDSTPRVVVLARRLGLWQSMCLIIVVDEKKLRPGNGSGCCNKSSEIIAILIPNFVLYPLFLFPFQFQL